MQRFGQIIGVKPEQIENYERIHAAVWPEVLAMIHACNMRNYSIFRHGDLLFAYFDDEVACREAGWRGDDLISVLLDVRIEGEPLSAGAITPAATSRKTRCFSVTSGMLRRANLEAPAIAEVKPSVCQECASSISS